MIITKFRSSSYNMYSLCQQQYFIHYVLGWPMPAGKKADMGTIVHKVLEVLARYKKAYQDNPRVPDPVFMHDEYVEWLVNYYFDYYTVGSKYKWIPADYRQCLKWVKDALSFNDGQFDPRRQNIIAPEMRFRFPIDADWATYNFVHPQTKERMTGQLQLQGTIDLVTQIRPEIYEVIDYKTGRMLDWATNEKKDFWSLCSDPQLRIYHYALSKLFPDIKQFVMTIYYIAYDSPFTMAYGPEDMTATEEMLRKRYEEIKHNTLPALIRNYDRWKCTRMCRFGKEKHPDCSEKTICQFIHELTREKGIDFVVENQTQLGFVIGEYNSPGSTT